MARQIPLAPLPARAAMRLLVACFAITAVIALAACGDDGDDASSSTDTTELSKITALTDSQYTALEKVYVASLPLDDLDDITKPAYKRAVGSVVAVCDRLDDDDPLLREIEATCPVTAELVDVSAAAFGCSDPAECGDAFEAAQATAQRVLDASRDSDAAVKATRLPAGCKKVLVAPPGVLCAARSDRERVRQGGPGEQERQRRGRPRCAASDRGARRPASRTQRAGPAQRLRRNCR